MRVMYQSLKSQYSLEEIHHEIETAMNINYALIPIAKSFLHLPLRLNHFLNKDPVFYLHLLKAGLADLREIMNEGKIQNTFQPNHHLFGDRISGYFAKEIGEDVPPDFEIQRLCHFAGPIAAAIYLDDTNALNDIISVPGFDINQSITVPSMLGNYDTIPLLNYAAFCGSSKAFKFILINGANPEATTGSKNWSCNGKWTAMDCCAASGKVGLMKILEDSGVAIKNSVISPATIFHRNELIDWLINTKLSFTKEDASTLLPTAISYDNLHMMDICLSRDPTYITDLIAKTSDTSQNQDWGWSSINLEPLWIALRSGHEQAAKILFEKNANTNIHDPEGNRLAHLAAAYGCTRFIQELLKLGEKIEIINVDSETPLHLAARNGYPETVAYLLDAGLDPNFPDRAGNTALFAAAENGYLDTCQTIIDFLDKKQNAEKQNLSSDQNDQVHSILEAQNKNRMTPLIRAAENGHSAVVKLLLERGREGYVNIKGSAGFWAALQLAAGQGYPEIVQILIEGGADVNTVDYCGRTPLHQAAMNTFPGPDTDCIAILLQHGANPNMADTSGWTPLGIASRHGDLRAVELLKTVGADVNAVMKGKMPIHWAALVKDENMIAKLLELGADPNALDENGKTYQQLLEAATTGN